jgi:hypothetical protein
MRRIMEGVDVAVVDVAPVIQDVVVKKRLTITEPRMSENLVEQVVVVTNPSSSSRRDTCKKRKQMLS